MESPNITITMRLGIITDIEVTDPPPRCHDCKKPILGLPGRVEHRERGFPSSPYPFPPPAPSSIAYVEWTCLPCVRKNDKWPELPLARRKHRANSRYDIDRRKLPDPFICAKCGRGIMLHFLNPAGCPFELREDLKGNPPS